MQTTLFLKYLLYTSIFFLFFQVCFSVQKKKKKKDVTFCGQTDTAHSYIEHWTNGKYSRKSRCVSMLKKVLLKTIPEF